MHELLYNKDRSNILFNEMQLFGFLMLIGGGGIWRSKLWGLLVHLRAYAWLRKVNSGFFLILIRERAIKY